MKLNYCVKFPDYVRPRKGKSFLWHHQLFADYRKWLEENVGVSEVDWAYITGDIHAAGICFSKEADLTAFLLKFNIK